MQPLSMVKKASAPLPDPQANITLEAPPKRPSPPTKAERAVTSQNKRPNQVTSLKCNMDKETEGASLDKLTENLRNISNLINNSHMQAPLPQPAPVPSKIPVNPAPALVSPVSMEIEKKKEHPEWQKKYSLIINLSRTEDELQKICGDHEKIVNLILEEEEEVIASHKQHIDEIVETVKQVNS